VHIPPDEAPHIHDAMVGGNGWASLSTIICRRGSGRGGRGMLL
jgi:hypothetical protein